MVWNYFLAVLPLYMALATEWYLKKNKKVPTVIFSLLWLLFFPNSIYMLTDFQYLCWYDFTLWRDYHSLSDNISLWVLLVNLVISIALGVIVGLISLDLMHGMARKKLSSKLCWGGVTVVSLVSSFGVYIGRFARLNSWDIVMPQKLVEDTLSVMTPFAPVFVLMFTVVTLLLYLCYYFLLRIKNNG